MSALSRLRAAGVEVRLNGEGERTRFERELERLRGFESAAVVVEPPMSALALGEYRSALNPKAAYESVVAFMCRYRLPFYFAQDRRGAERFTYSFLRHFLRTVERRYQAVAKTKAQTLAKGAAA